MVSAELRVDFAINEVCGGGPLPTICTVDENADRARSSPKTQQSALSVGLRVNSAVVDNPWITNAGRGSRWRGQLHGVTRPWLGGRASLR